MGASLSMCLGAQGMKTTEDVVNKVMGCKPMQGASWEQALAAAQHFGMRATLVTPCSMTQLREWTDRGVAVMIAWNPEGRDWSHASVVFDVTDDAVHIADPNIPDPEQTVRVISRTEFLGKWGEKWPDYIVRRPALAIEREITEDGRQVQASMSEPINEVFDWGFVSVSKEPLKTRPDYGSLLENNMLITAEDFRAALLSDLPAQKSSKFEKGKPADPTKNMSSEDADEWERQNEENKDNFKSAGDLDSAYFRKSASSENRVLISCGDYEAELKESKFEKGKSVPLSELPDELQENVENPPESVKKLTEKLKDKAASKTAEWKEWTEDMPVQVVGDNKAEVFENLAAAKKKYPELDPRKNTKKFTWAMKDTVKGQPAIRFETHAAYHENTRSASSESDKTAALGLYGFTKEAERVCGSATNRLSKFTTKLAKEIYTKDAETSSFLEEHEKRTGSRAARMLRSCMGDIGPGPKKTAAKRESGRYGYGTRTAKLALQACSDVEQEAGIIASDLHGRMGSKHSSITGYLGKHAKSAKCGWSEMIQEAYPPAPAPITASVKEIISWQGGKNTSRSAGSFLAAEDDEDESEED